MKKASLLLIASLSCLLCSAQSTSSGFGFDLRVPMQVDFQSYDEQHAWGRKHHESTAVNFGIDALATYGRGKLGLYAGAGYFRNRFNLSRFFDRQVLNPGRDSLPIHTRTSSYTYSLLRLPVGGSFRVAKIGSTQLALGGEWIFNFSFSSRYNGSYPIANPDKTLNEFDYYGSMANLFVRISPKTGGRQLSFEPFVRVFNRYRTDPLFYEDAGEHNNRSFDAVGLNIRMNLF